MSINKTVKNALLVYSHPDSNVFNIGDYVQSIAAKQFLPNVNYYLDREHLNENIGEDVRLIMNGWFMHRPENWPPTPEITPLFVAFHLNKLVENEMLTDEGVRYLKKHEPIGCRDYHTVSLLKGKGVDAYFSGCLTLTLGNTYQHIDVPNAPIYLTDLNSTLQHNFKFKINCAIAIATKLHFLKKIQARMLERGIVKRLRTIAAFYVTYRSVLSDDVFVTAEYREQEIEDRFTSDDEKFNYANELLNEYSKARYVVTSRIHCALPCLAMGTPVVFVTNDLIGEVHNCRLDGLKQLFHTLDIDLNGIKCKIPGISKLTTSTAFKNKVDYKVLAERLISRCQAFIDKD